MPTNTQHITPSELKDMLPQKPERMNTVPEPKRQQLVAATYDVVGCLGTVGFPKICNFWEEEEARPLHLLQRNLIMDRRFRRGHGFPWRDDGTGEYLHERRYPGHESQ